MNNLNNAIYLYKDNARIKSLKIEYALREDKRERQVLRIALYSLGYKVK